MSSWRTSTGPSAMPARPPPARTAASSSRPPQASAPRWLSGPRIVARPNSHVAVGNVRFGNDLPLTLIAGPCQMESRDHAFDMAAALQEICGRAGIGFVYKTSFDKANRTSLRGRRGVGLDGALPVFADIREKFGLPVLSDVHEQA